MIHGHGLLIQHINKDKNISGKTIIEIGCTRELHDGQQSSEALYSLSKDLGFMFITVDMDPENIDSLKQRANGINAICRKGEEFLKEYLGRIDYLYLDAFDFYHSNHNNKRKESYRKNLGCEINDKLCHQAHLDFCQNSIDKMASGAIIVIDDVIDQYRGKGVTAIPFLLSNGFKSLASQNNCRSFIKE